MQQAMHIQSTVQKLSENEREGVLTHPITSHYAIINLSPHLLLLILNTTQPILHPQVADLSLAAHLDSLHQLLDWLRVKAHVGGVVIDLWIIISACVFFENSLVDVGRNVFFLTCYDSMRKLVLFLELLVVTSALNACFCFDIILHFPEEGVRPTQPNTYFRTSLDLTFSLFISMKWTYLACSSQLHLKFFLTSSSLSFGNKFSSFLSSGGSRLSSECTTRAGPQSLRQAYYTFIWFSIYDYNLTFFAQRINLDPSICLRANSESSLQMFSVPILQSSNLKIFYPLLYMCKRSQHKAIKKQDAARESRAFHILTQNPNSHATIVRWIHSQNLITVIPKVQGCSALNTTPLRCGEKGVALNGTWRMPLYLFLIDIMMLHTCTNCKNTLNDVDQPQKKQPHIYHTVLWLNLFTFYTCCHSFKINFIDITKRQINEFKPSLYLKQFFNNYFQRQQHTEIISALANGLTVLETLITHFEQHTSIHTQQHHGKKEEKDVNQIVEDIYNRLAHIFETIRQQKEAEADNLFSSRKVTPLEKNIQDDELYEILNKYKTDFKRQKEERIRLQKEIDSLKDSLHHLKAEREKTAERANSSEKALERAKNENRHLQATISSLKQQIEHLQNYKQQAEAKVEQMLQLEIAHNSMNKDYELLLLKYDQSKQQRSLLEEKFKHLDAIVESKVQRNQAKWTKKIEEKLSNSQIYEQPACRAFRQFIKSFNKENTLNNT